MDLVKGCACGGGCGEEPHSAHWAPRSASCPRLLSTRCSARCIVLGTSLARLVRRGPRALTGKRNATLLGYATDVRPIKFDPDPAPPYRHRVLGGKIKVFEQIYSRSSVVAPRGECPRERPAPGTTPACTQHDAPVLPSSPRALDRHRFEEKIRPAHRPGRTGTSP